jgi:DNA-binding Xre family transcriptional regulator
MEKTEADQAAFRERIVFEPRNPVAEFQDEHGDTQTIHRPKGRRLSVYRGGNTPVLRMNRAVAVLLGERIRARRLMLGMTQEQLCLKAGFVHTHPKQRMADIERATRAEGIRLGSLYAVAYALGCHPGDLLPPMDDVMKLAGVGPQAATPLVVTGK